MIITTEKEKDGMRKAGEAVGTTLREMVAYTKEGMSTKEIDNYGKRILRSYGAFSAPRKDYKFPGSTCISINHEVCHGIPAKDKIVKVGDLINIDVSASLNGYYGDNGCSFVVGEDLYGHQPLIDASLEILHLCMKVTKAGERISEIGGTMEKEAKRRGYKTIKNICGHGVGYKLHEHPREIPCFRDRWNRSRLKKNTVIALETFISTKAQYVHETQDGWTMKTKDKSYVAQHEHTIMITDGQPIIFTEANGLSIGFV